MENVYPSRDRQIERRSISGVGPFSEVAGDTPGSDSASTHWLARIVSELVHLRDLCAFCFFERNRNVTVPTATLPSRTLGSWAGRKQILNFHR